MRSSHDPTFPLYPICTCIAFFLCLIPLPWQVQARNPGTCAFMIWTALSCLIYFVDSLVWAGNVSNPTPVWCDIATRVMIGVSIGIPAAILRISQWLYASTYPRTASDTRIDKRRVLLVDLSVTLGLPLLIMCLHLIIQPHRFDIYEDVGCYPATSNTLPSYFIYLMWPAILGVVSCFYLAMSFRSFALRRAQTTQLISSNSSLSVARYFRLLILALLCVMFTVSLAIVAIVHGLRIGVSPWTSWADTHRDFSRVDLFPATFWRSNPLLLSCIDLTRWLPVFCAFSFFVLFGFASEARKAYADAFRIIFKPFRKEQDKDKETKTSASSRRGLKPLKLVDKSNNQVTRLPISNPILIASSNPSLATIVVTASNKSKAHDSDTESALESVDTFSISSFSLYGPSIDLPSSYHSSSSRSSLEFDEKPPRLPEIPLSPPLSSSPALSPTLCVPNFVEPTFHTTPPRPGCLPSPIYHRPFCGHTMYPVTKPHPNAQQGILVTVHRQASVDHIV